jgi:uncharacterized protein YkwD
MTVPELDSTRAPLWRRWAWPLALVILLALAAATIARAATPPVEEAAARVQAPGGRALIPELTAPVPTVSPAPYVSPIEVVLPPPPAPPATTSRSAGVTTPAAWCDGKYGATASASGVSGLLAAINAERAVWGLVSLSWSNTLASSAQSWSEAQASANSMSHGDAPSPGGQNVAYRYSSVGQSEASAATWAHSAWMTSPGHCKNILHSSWRSVGAGAASVDGGKTWYLTENFQ